MVSLITEGRATDNRGRPFPYRRQHRWIIMVAILAVICVVVWIKAATTEPRSRTAMACNPPSAAGPNAPRAEGLGDRVTAERLADVQPAPLAQARVRVYNASAQHGLAEHIASRLSDYGFASPPTPQYANDPVYVNGDLECTGQIRFGSAGRPAAAAVQLVSPCAELIEDRRPDDSVDLALGSLFGNDLRPGNDAEEVLKSLRNPAPGAAIDAKLLEAARKGHC